MIKIGVLREQVDGERRVALSPDDVRRFGRRVSILVERGAGEAAGFSDPSYFRAGARILDREGVLAEAGIVTAIHPVAAPGALKAKSVLVSRGGKDPAFRAALATAEVAHLALEHAPAALSAPTAMPVCDPADASRLFGRGVSAVIEHLLEHDIDLKLDRQDPLISAMLFAKSVEALPLEALSLKAWAA